MDAKFVKTGQIWTTDPVHVRAVKCRVSTLKVKDVVMSMSPVHGHGLQLTGYVDVHDVDTQRDFQIEIDDFFAYYILIRE